MGGRREKERREEEREGRVREVEGKRGGDDWRGEKDQGRPPQLGLTVITVLPW